MLALLPPGSLVQGEFARKNRRGSGLIGEMRRARRPGARRYPRATLYCPRIGPRQPLGLRVRAQASEKLRDRGCPYASFARGDPGAGETVPSPGLESSGGALARPASVFVAAETWREILQQQGYLSMLSGPLLCREQGTFFLSAPQLQESIDP